jgi:two-component system sensor histidine kinase BarA
MAQILRLLVLTCIFVWPILSSAEIYVADSDRKMLLNEQVRYLEGQVDRLTVQEAIANLDKFSATKTGNPSYGVSHQGIWLLAELTNLTDVERWVVEVNFAQNTEVEFYTVIDNVVTRQSIQGTKSRAQKTRIPTYQFSMGKDSPTKILIYVANSALNRIAPIALSAEAEYSQSLVFHSLLWGAFFGGLLMLFVYNLMQFYGTNERSILAYAVYLLSVAIWEFVWNGHSQLFSLGNVGLWLVQNVSISLVAVGLSSGLFTLSFLNAYETAPKTSKFIYVSMAGLSISGVFILMNVFEPDVQGIIANIVSMISVITYTVAGFESYFNRFKPARYFIFAWTVLAFCALTGMLTLVGILPTNNFTTYAFPVGVFIEAGLFSLALFEKIRSNLRLEIHKATRELRSNMIYIEEQNARLDISRKKAIAASKVKSQFLANMSHEIRTPLNAIVGFCQELTGLLLPRDKQQHVEIINSSASHLMHIINDVLDFSKIEAGKLEIKTEVFSPLSLIEQLATLMSKQAYNKGLEFVLDLQPLPKKLLGDAPRIRQVVTNLLSNAIKFTPSGHVSIRVESRELDNNLVELNIVVEDTGIGIAEHDKSKLFAAFSQLDGDINRTYQGTGLGLVISQQLVKLMHGDLTFDSTLGEGTSFTLTLHLNRLSYKVEPDKDPKWQGATIAILDSYPSSRRAVASMFGQFGAEVTSIDSLAYFREMSCQGFDYLFVSCSVEWLYGGSFGTECLSAFSAKTKVLTYSSNEDLNHLAAIEHCFSMVIERPFLPSNVLKVFEPRDYKKTDKRSEKLSQLPAVNILAVDDTEINLHLLSTWLKQSPVKLTLSYSGQDAIAKAEEESFDLILMDLQMPQIDGIQATQTIRKTELNQGTPIIAMTAHAFNEEKDKMLQQGMDDYLAKPIDFNTLISLITLWCGDTEDEQSREADSGENFLLKKPHEQSIDWDSALNLTGGNEKDARDMLDLFLEQLHQLKGHILFLSKQKKWDELAAATHKLHGACCYTGVPILKNYCLQIEDSLKAGDMAYAELLVKKLEAEGNRIIDISKEEYGLSLGNRWQVIPNPLGHLVP